MFSSGSAFNQLVAKATSEALPYEDISLNLQVCDHIRSKQTTPAAAIKVLKERLSHKNPNVQLFTLKLIEMCVKNCGSGFHVEVASKPFIDQLLSMVQYNIQTNVDVKNKVLELIQAWAIAFQGKYELAYVCEIYNRLKAEGMHFPPPSSEAVEIRLDASTAPDWTDSDVCMRCREAFTTFRRKHHCRNCGQTFCQTCSSKKMSLPHFGLDDEVRVCDGCYDAKVSGRPMIPPASATPSPSPYGVPQSQFPAFQQSPYTSSYQQHPYQAFSPASSVTPSSTPYQSSYQPSSTPAAAQDTFEEDLRRAMEMSLSESQPRSQAPAPAPVSRPAAPSSSVNEEEDPELAAAIAASLREVTISAPSSKGSKPSAKTPSSSGAAKRKPNSDNLTEKEKDKIRLFSELITKIERSGDSVIGNKPIQDTYSEICTVHTKLMAELEDVDEKLRRNTELSEKISKINEMYQKIVEERMALVSRRTEVRSTAPVPPSSNGWSSAKPPGKPQQGGYPSYPGQDYSSPYAAAPYSAPSHPGPHSAAPPTSYPSGGGTYAPAPGPGPAPSSTYHPPAGVPRDDGSSYGQPARFGYDPAQSAPPPQDYYYGAQNASQGQSPAPGYHGSVQYPPAPHQYPAVQNQFATPSPSSSSSNLLDI